MRFTDLMCGNVSYFRVFNTSLTSISIKTTTCHNIWRIFFPPWSEPGLSSYIVQFSVHSNYFYFCSQNHYVSILSHPVTFSILLLLMGSIPRNITSYNTLKAWSPIFPNHKLWSLFFLVWFNVCKSIFVPLFKYTDPILCLILSLSLIFGYWSLLSK